MIDTHCHLTDPRLLPQIDDVIARARAAGVVRMVTIGTEPSDWQPCIDVCRRFDNVRCAVGVHPNHCHEVDPAEVPRLREVQREPAVVALGEMGLDYHHAFAPRELQLKFFEMQLELAAELKRAVVIHSRESIDDCLAVMRNYTVPAAVFHCFTGSAAEAKNVLDAGYLIGFTGVVTFKNAPQLREIARTMPADRILVETDAPYLSPEPFRKQKVNEPALVMHTAAAVATARGVSIEEIDQLTTANASRFYGWE